MTVNTQPLSDKIDNNHNENNTSFDLINLKETYAQEITQYFELQSESQSLLKQDHTPSEFLHTLIENDYYNDAVAFVAHAIPVRKATWWACLCGRDHLANSDQLYQQAYTAGENWVRNPTEENRRKAEVCAEESDYNTAAGWIAAAAFWSGGNIEPEGEPTMEPPEHLYAKAVTSAIVMSATFDYPSEKEVKARYQNYLKQGVNIANSDKG